MVATLLGFFLPPELIDAVVDELQGDFHTLLACNSTCRRLRCRARTHIWRSVVFSDMRENEGVIGGRLRLSFADARESCIAWNAIKHLEIVMFSEVEEVWATFMESLGGRTRQICTLKSLVLQGERDSIPAQCITPFFDALHKRCRSLTYLDLEHSCDWHPGQLAYLVSGFRALRHLAVSTSIRRVPDSEKGGMWQAPSCLSTLSVSSTGSGELELVAALAQHLGREDIARLLFVDSFFLPELLESAARSPKLSSFVKGISVDKTSEDTHFVRLLDAFPSLEFLCITARMDLSYYARPDPCRCSLVDTAKHILAALADQPRALRYLALATELPAQQALDPALTDTRLPELCDALRAPHTQHLCLVLLCVLDPVGSVVLTDLELQRAERNIDIHFKACLSQWNAPGRRRCAAIVMRGGVGDCDWRDMTGPPMQRLMAACVTGRFSA